MSESKCPICGSNEFYVNDPVDEYETFELSIEKGEVVFSCECDELKRPDIGKDTVIHCNLCTWQGMLVTIDR
jgi:hypothetical protein